MDDVSFSRNEGLYCRLAMNAVNVFLLREANLDDLAPNDSFGPFGMDDIFALFGCFDVFLVTSWLFSEGWVSWRKGLLESSPSEGTDEVFLEYCMAALNRVEDDGAKLDETSPSCDSLLLTRL